MSGNPQSVAYKESGIPWVGKIPEHWEMRRVKYILSYKKGKNPKSFSDTPNENIYLTMEFLRKKYKKIFYIEDTSDLIRVSEGDILLLWDGANAGEFISAQDGYLASTMAVIKFSGVEKNYAKHFLVLIEKELRSQTNGMGIPHVSGSLFENLFFILPPLKEQQAIADFLDKKTCQIEEFIDKKQKLITLLEEKKQALINQCVTQGLDSSTPLKDSGVEWLGKIPTHWEVKKLKYVVSLRNQKEGESDFRIGLENIESKTGRFIQADESAFDDEGIGFFEGDVLFGKLRPYLAKVFLADRNGICVSEFLVLKSEKIFNRFLKFLMLSGAFIDVVNGSTYGTKMPRANWEFIGNLKIPLPPLEEQKAIAEYLDTQIEKIDCVIFKIKSQINLIKEYKSTLISEAVCGRTGIKQ